MTSLACSCTDHRTAELCGVKAKLSQVCLLFWQSQIVPTLKGSLINLHSNEKDTFHLGKECKFLVFGKGFIFSQQNKQALRMLCKERLCKPSAPEIQITCSFVESTGKIQILSRDTHNWGFPIIPRGAGAMNFPPLPSSMLTALLLCPFAVVSSTLEHALCRGADTSPFGFISHNQRGWINMEVVNIDSQNPGSFVPINMCYLSALGSGFTQQSRHESHCCQQSAVSYYLQHKVDCCYCACEFHPLQPWDTLLPCIGTSPDRGINSAVSME